VVHHIISVFFDSVIVYLDHSRPRNGRRKLSEECRKARALKGRAPNLIFASHIFR
jgi:hypothetical protein